MHTHINIYNFLTLFALAKYNTANAEFNGELFIFLIYSMQLLLCIYEYVNKFNQCSHHLFSSSSHIMFRYIGLSRSGYVCQPLSLATRCVVLYINCVILIDMIDHEIFPWIHRGEDRKSVV